MEPHAIVQRAKEKDTEALDIIYRTYYPKMVGICMNITREDRATVDDLVHDAFVLAFVSISNLRDNSRLCEWLTTIVRNVSLKHVQQRDRLRFLPISSVDNEDAVFVDSSSSPESELNFSELLSLVGRLPEGYGKILRMSVIEGFSHQEIADMLGIAPHSSSSQLSRAKRLLRRIIDSKTIAFVAALLLPLAAYLVFFHKEEKGSDDEVHVVVDQVAPTHREEDHRPAGQNGGPEDRQAVHSSAPTTTMAITTSQPFGTFLPADTDSVADTDILMTQAPCDTLNSELNESHDVSLPFRTVIATDSSASERFRRLRYLRSPDKKPGKWQLLAAGSLGPALAQSVYRLIATNGSSPTGDQPEPDGSSVQWPEYVTTWEEYARYLKAVSSPSASADTLQLIEIAERNTGKIQQKEHHDKPITFGISLTKPLGGKWSVETGLQYTILRSQFSLGESGDSAVSRQQVHYLGIPLRLSFNWIQHRQLSAYSSLGVTMHIPVYGKVSGSYYLDRNAVFNQSSHFSPSMQWQTNASLGLQYSFTPHTSIFVEPTLNWYIPSGSDTHTIWTERQFMFTCPLGIRVTW
ncbi:MAG: sigma-70 family RNA polymerase sigma factor [Prevotella sp.]|nr:sigma-70 family RNA polymerase sigma factor [Prevotella sp.]